ncbi:MAG: hypothetical protein R3B84_08755 [Zavarzinella sp.]
MKTILFRSLLCALLGMPFAVSVNHLPAEEKAMMQPVYTPLTLLKLPVDLPPALAQSVKEVQMYVKQSGSNWAKVQQLTSKEKLVFEHQVAADGEYYITFVMIDQQGKASPENLNQAQPHMRVIVDTMPPEVGLKPITNRGESYLECIVKDLATNWSSLVVEYAASADRWVPLQPLSVDSPTLFKLPNNSVLESQIRVSVKDHAGQQTKRIFDLADPTASMAPQAGNSFPVAQGKPDVSMFPGTTNTVRRTDSAPSVPVIPSLPENMKVPEVSKPVVGGLPTMPESPPFGKADPEVKPAGFDLRMPEIPKIPGVGNTPGSTVTQKPMSPPDVPAVPSMGDIIKQPAAPGGLPKDIISPPEPRPTPVSMSTEKRPSHTILNSAKCTIHYQPEGVVRVAARVDFWATKDNGRTWIPLRDESGGVSPAKLVLPGDGIYGIRIRPGSGSKPPEPGEEADCVIEVDTTLPTVNLLQPTLGTGSDDGTMLIVWTASDKNLVINSINLYYATHPEGPWKVIVQGHKNVGLYRWTMPSEVTGTLHLRMEASDHAGNVGKHDLRTVVPASGSAARVKILEITPGK